ncbi:hypothetical protein [Neorhizobium sp. DT-125]|uniref:hypothetical protein n=1 Tax=Neorhizobium sp. DT-125 TaxID=3396163 RepID=UPI003F1E1CEC
MANVALKKEIEGVVAQWPAMPQFDLPRFANDNKGDALSSFSRQTKAYNLDMAKRRSNMLLLISQLEDILARASAAGNEEHVRELISELAPVWEVIDERIDNAIATLNVGAELREGLDFIYAHGSVSHKRVAKHIEKRYRELALERVRLFQDMKDRLSRVIWDHDPDARGGPAFDKADDLIAFLNS